MRSGAFFGEMQQCSDRGDTRRRHDKFCSAERLVRRAAGCPPFCGAGLPSVKCSHALTERTPAVGMTNSALRNGLSAERTLCPPLFGVFLGKIQHSPRGLSPAGRFLRFLFVKPVNPVGFFVINQIDRRADRPGQRIRDEEKQDLVADAHGNLNVNDAEHAPNQ